MDPLPPPLADRCRRCGVDPDAPGDPADAWRRLFERFGARATLLDRFALEAAARGTSPEALPRELRRRLAHEVIRASWPGFEWATGAADAASDPVVIAPPDPTWPARFQEIRARLARALGERASRIDHVGSTAVPGLAAKPVIDVQVVVADLEAEAAYVPAIESLGLALRSRDALHRYFRPPPPKNRDVQVHVCARGSAWERDHLLFRDYLRAHEDAATAYGRLKTSLARRHRDDRLAYTDAKTEFILDALEVAATWASRVGWTLPVESA